MPGMPSSKGALRVALVAWYSYWARMSAVRLKMPVAVRGIGRLLEVVEEVVVGDAVGIAGDAVGVEEVVFPAGAEVAGDAPEGDGEVVPAVGNGEGAEIDEAGEAPVFHENVGDAVVAVAEDEVFGRGTLALEEGDGLAGGAVAVGGEDPVGVARRASSTALVPSRPCVRLGRA